MRTYQLYFGITVSCIIHIVLSQAVLPDNQGPSYSWNRKTIVPTDHVYLDDMWKIQSHPELQTPILRAPHPTFGMILPLPSFWSSTRRFHPVDVDRLEFKVLGVTNYIIEAAVNRYRQLIAVRTGLSVYAPHWSQDEPHLAGLADQSPATEAVGTAGADWHLAERYTSTWSETRSRWVAKMFDAGLEGDTHSPKLSKVLIRVKSAGSSWPSLRMDESYAILVEKRTIYLFANETWGALRGLESLSQLLWRTSDKSQVYINQTYIFDRPRFPHRGLLVDTSRHFISKSILLVNLEAMAHNKLNVFHWHIVDDNSFPYQSDAFPELSKKGAFMRNQVYTGDDIREIVEFARMRGIRVIPEFDLPGHTRSLAYGKPELLSQCHDPVHKMVHFGPLAVFNNDTYTFLFRFIQEAIKLFPDEFMHLGGDEVDQSCWNADTELNQQRDKLNLKSVTFGEYFWRRVQNMFATIAHQNLKNRRRLIFWEEVFGSVTEVQKSAVMHAWKSNLSPNLAFADQVVYSACWYLDLLGDNRQWAPYYLCDPSEKIGQIENSKPVILGGEACMWSEYQSDDTILTRIWPVTSGIAERLWSPAFINSLETLGPRIEEHRCRMISRGFPQAVLLGPGSCEIPGAFSSYTTINHADNHVASEKPASQPIDLSNQHRVFYFVAGAMLGSGLVLVLFYNRELITVYRKFSPSTISLRRLSSLRFSTLTVVALITVGCFLIWLV